MRGFRIWAILLGAGLVLTLVFQGVKAHVRALSHEGVYPYQNAWQTVRGVSRSTADLLLHAHENQQERRRLEREVDELRYEVAHLQRVSRENEQLRRQWEFATESEARVVNCRILARGGSGGWWQRIRIDKGMQQGIRPGQPVLTPDGLVGHISEASARTSTVLLVTDPNCQVACEFDPPHAGARGIVVGAGVRSFGHGDLELLFTVEPLRMRFVERSAEIGEGTRVITSGLGGIYPRGLPVGRVVSVQLDRSGLFQRATVAPAANVASLSFVLVMVEGSTS